MFFYLFVLINYELSNQQSKVEISTVFHLSWSVDQQEAKKAVLMLLGETCARRNMYFCTEIPQVANYSQQNQQVRTTNHNTTYIKTINATTRHEEDERHRLTQSLLCSTALSTKSSSGVIKQQQEQ